MGVDIDENVVHMAILETEFVRMHVTTAAEALRGNSASLPRYAQFVLRWSAVSQHMFESNRVVDNHEQCHCHDNREPEG